jgi:hypothetical protein
VSESISGRVTFPGEEVYVCVAIAEVDRSQRGCGLTIIAKTEMESRVGRFIFRDGSWENKRDKGKKRGKRRESRQDILIIC